MTARSSAVLLSFFAALAGASSACDKANARREATFEMTWELTKAGTCEAPGHERFKGQREVTLRFAQYPQHFVVFCSTPLAEQLEKGQKNTTSATFLIDDGNRGAHSTCEVGGMKGTLLERERDGHKSCRFEGEVLSGHGGPGGDSADAPGPWDAPR